MRLYNISINNLRRRKAKMAFLVIGLVIGVTTVVTLITITKAMKEDIAKKLDEYGANILIVPRSEDLSLSYGGMAISGVSFAVRELREADITKVKTIKNRENISTIAPKLLGVVRLEARNVLLVGVDFSEELRLKKWWKIHGLPPQSKEEILLGSEVALKLGKKIGDTIPIRESNLRVSGIIEETGSQDDALIFTHLSTAQKILEKAGTLTLIELAALCNTCPIEEIVRQLSEVLPQARVTAIKQAVQSRMETVERFETLSFGISIIVLLISALIIFTTMMASVNERTREIGIFRAIGFRRSQVMKIIFLEAFIISLLGGVTGYLLGYGTSTLVVPLVANAKEIEVDIDPTMAIGTIALSILVGISATIYPAWHASRLDPTVALRSL